MIELGFTIYAMCRHALDLKIWVVVLLFLAAGFVPCGCTIAFVVLKLTHRFVASWWWILLSVFSDTVKIIAISSNSSN